MGNCMTIKYETYQYTVTHDRQNNNQHMVTKDLPQVATASDYQAINKKYFSFAIFQMKGMRC